VCGAVSVNALDPMELGQAPGGVGLVAHHRERLVKTSAVSEEVIAARGYWTATWPHQLLALGYNQSQARLASEQTPVLVTPLYEVSGVPAVYVIGSREYEATIIRPDKPRLNGKGKVLKYEKPFKSRNVLDLNPLMAEILASGDVPVAVTEGSIKADSLASIGIPCIGLSGVWNWLGRTDQRNSAPLPEWIELDVDEMFIVFDSDAQTNESVLKAAQRLERHLLREVGIARVDFITPPAAADGSKQGIDDYRAAGGDVADLLKSAGSVPERARLHDENAEALLEEMLALLDAENGQKIAATPERWATWLDIVRTKPGGCRGRRLREVNPTTGLVGWRGGGRCKRYDCPACLDRQLRTVILPALATWAAGRDLWAGWEEPATICKRRGKQLWLQRHCKRDYLANRLRGHLLAPLEFEGSEAVPEELRARALLLAVLAAPAQSLDEPLGRDRFIFPNTVEVFRKREKRVLVRNRLNSEQKWVTVETAEALDSAVWTTEREPNGTRHLFTRNTVEEFRDEINDRYGLRLWSGENDAQPTVLSPEHVRDYIENVAEPEHNKAVELAAILRDPENRIIKGEPLYGAAPTPEIPSGSCWWQ